MLTTYHEWEKNGKLYRAVYDEDHATRGRYGYDTEEETRTAEDEEIAGLNSGRLVALGIITSERKRPKHCDSCKCRKLEWEETDSVWGCVVENDTRKLEEYAESF